MRKLFSKNRMFVLRMLLCWLPLLAGTWLLYGWSKAGDPRFYSFMDTRPGQIISRTFDWHDTPLAFEPRDKSVDEMTAQELEIKRQIEEQLRSSMPKHRLTFRNQRTMEGRIVKEERKHLLFEEDYGDNGAVSVKVRKNRIKSIETLDEGIPEVTYRDVALQMEFPAMRLYKREPYTILTDESYFKVEDAMRVVRRLRDDVLFSFRELVVESEHHRAIQILFFSDEASFRNCQKKYAPHMENTAGFYSPWADRLVLFNQIASKQMQEVYGVVAEQEEKYRSQAVNTDQRMRVRSWKKHVDRDMEKLAEEYTRSTIRHEGAHQLLFKYGIHSSHHVEHEWLVEGLATYCETRKVGAIDRVRLERVRDKQKEHALLPLEELVNARQTGGFMALGSVEDIDLAYSQSWVLIHLLMDPEHRDDFFRYIRYVRNPIHFKELRRRDRYLVLCEFLDLSPEQLEEKWLGCLATL